MSAVPSPGVGRVGGAGALTTEGPRVDREADLLPAPIELGGDEMAALYALLAEGSREDGKAAKVSIEAAAAHKLAQRREQEAALERARQAAEDQRGFFDSIGLGGLFGIAMANPILVLADVSMHMARVTPEFLREFEDENKDAIEVATKLYAGIGNAAAVASGIGSPESIRAAIALGGLILQETELLGKETSDRLGAVMVLTGSQNGRAAANAVIADKDSTVADDIRELERETQEYTKWVAVAGMAVAATAAIIGSLGTATAPVVIIGVALSAGGFAVAETKCLDPLLGESASTWVGSAMMLSGALVSGAGAAAAAQQVSTGLAEVSRSVAVAGAVVDGGAKVRLGFEGVRDAAIQHEVDTHHRTAEKHGQATQRLQRMVEDIIDSVRDLKESHTRMSRAISEAVETQCQTQLIAATMRG